MSTEMLRGRAHEHENGGEIITSMAYNIIDVKAAKGLKFVHMNVRSLLLNLDEIHACFLDGAFDAVVLTETWLHARISDTLISNRKYTCTRLDRQTTLPSGAIKTGGGICIYIKIEHSLEILMDHSISDNHLELLHVVLRFNRQKNIHIIAVYRPPTGNVVVAVDKINGILIEIGRNDEIVLTGDFNVNLLNKSTQATKTLSKMAMNRSLQQLIVDPTRVTRKSATLIDLMFTNCKYVSTSGIMDCILSDHNPVFMIKKKSRTENGYIEKWCRPIKELDIDSFIAEIYRYVDTISLEDRNPSVIWDEFYCKVTEILDLMCPKRLMRVHVNNASYIDDTLRSLMKDRDTAFRLVRRNNCDANWARARYLRAKVRSEFNKARRRFILNSLEVANGDGKKFWHIINSNFFENKPPTIDRVMSPSDDRLLYGVEAANAINDYFCNISVTLASNLPRAPSPLTDENVPQLRTMYVDRARLICENVVPLIRGIDTSKASGFQEINSTLMKRIFLALPIFFTELLNLCLDSGIFPDSWKKAIPDVSQTCVLYHYFQLQGRFWNTS